MIYTELIGKVAPAGEVLPLRPGERLGIGGRFELLAPTGEGGEATVWLARDHRVGGRVALKLLRSDGFAAYVDTQRLLHELSILCAFDEPHLVRVVDFGIDTDRGLYWYAMEWLNGCTVRQLIEGHGPLTWHEAASVARQVCLGLRAMHAKHVVHADIKSSNVFIAGDDVDSGVVKLIDFGVAVWGRYAQETVQATVVGITERWAPPEALVDGRISRRSDIYQVGLLLYEMLTGHHPFGERNGEELIYAICNGPRPPPVTPPGRPPVPSELADLCVRAMAVAPDDRPRSAHALLEALDGVLVAHGLKPAPYIPAGDDTATRVVHRKLGHDDGAGAKASARRPPTAKGPSSSQRPAAAPEDTRGADEIRAALPERYLWLRRVVRFFVVLFVKLPKRWARAIGEAEEVVSEELEREGVLPPRPPRAPTDQDESRGWSFAGGRHATQARVLTPVQDERLEPGPTQPDATTNRPTQTPRRVDHAGAASTRGERSEPQPQRHGPSAPDQRPKEHAPHTSAAPPNEVTPPHPRPGEHDTRRRGRSFSALVVAGTVLFAFLAYAAWTFLGGRARQAPAHRDRARSHTARTASTSRATGTGQVATRQGESSGRQRSRRGRWNMPFPFPGREHLAQSLAAAKLVPLTRLWRASWLEVAQRLIPYGWKWVDLESPINLASRALIYRPRTTKERGTGPHPMSPTLEVRFDDANRPWRLYLRFRSHFLDLLEQAERAWGKPDAYITDFDGMLCPLWRFADAVVWARKFTRWSGPLAGLTWTALVVADPARYERNTALRRQRFTQRN